MFIGSLRISLRSEHTGGLNPEIWTDWAKGCRTTPQYRYDMQTCKGGGFLIGFIELISVSV
jgi:hypothetical protein